MHLGATASCVITKWGGRRHWEYAGLWLGSDPHGDWLGFAAGTRFTRPGAEYVAPYDQVGLVPAGADQHWLATFHAEPSPVAVYVDIATPATWEGSTLRAVDLDLDVIRGRTGRVWIDDEDEFAEHRVSLGYPEPVVSAALASCVLIEAALLAGEPPFDGSHLSWLAILAQLNAASEQ